MEDLRLSATGHYVDEPRYPYLYTSVNKSVNKSVCAWYSHLYIPLNISVHISAYILVDNNLPAAWPPAPSLARLRTAARAPVCTGVCVCIYIGKYMYISVNTLSENFL